MSYLTLPSLRHPTRYERLVYVLTGRWPQSYADVRLVQLAASEEALDYWIEKVDEQAQQLADLRAHQRSHVAANEQLASALRKIAGLATAHKCGLLRDHNPELIAELAQTALGEVRS